MTSRPILIFDFDGTVALGDGPVLAYAHHVAEALGAPSGFVDGIGAALASATPEALDGYDVVRVAAEAAGADADLLSAAYLASRAQLATASAPIVAPVGLAAFLRGLDAECILVTNAPAVRIDEALDQVGLGGVFDRIVTDAAKPAGLSRLLDELAPGSRVLSVGDIWHNDLAPAHRRGHATALVGTFPNPDAEPTYRAATLAELLPDLLRWLRSGPESSSSALTNPLTTEG